MPGLIWITTVQYSYDIHEDVFEKLFFLTKMNLQTTITCKNTMHAKSVAVKQR